MEIAVERLVALALLVTGLSHIAAPQAWAALFDRIKDSGETAGIFSAAINLPIALMITAFHNVWTWPEVTVTLLGWALLIKGALHAISSKIAQRSLALAGEGAAAERRYRIAGLAMLPLALAVGWISLT